MATAMISSLTKIPVRPDVAMTGEITLRGKVLPIGGMKEKLLAAHRAGIKVAVLPKGNEKDLSEVPQNIQEHFSMHFVETMDEVLKIALEDEIPVTKEKAGGQDRGVQAFNGEGFFSRFHNPLKIYSAELACSAPDPSRFPRDDLPEIAFIGRSNVGKSSLINSLLGRHGTRPHQFHPGTNPADPFFQNQRTFLLCRLPGLWLRQSFKRDGDLAGLVCSTVISRQREKLAVCVSIIDSRIGPTGQDLQTLERLRQFSLPFFMVSTKADRLSGSELQKSLNHTRKLAPAATVVAFSATRRTGRDKVWALLSRHIQGTVQP